MGMPAGMRTASRLLAGVAAARGHSSQPLAGTACTPCGVDKASAGASSLVQLAPYWIVRAVEGSASEGMPVRYGCVLEQLLSHVPCRCEECASVCLGLVLLVSEMTGAIVYGLGELRRKPCTTLSVRPMATPFGAAYLLGGIDDVGSLPYTVVLSLSSW